MAGATNFIHWKDPFSDLLRIIIAPESDVDGRPKRLFIWATSLRVLRLPLTSNLNSKIKELISSNCFLSLYSHVRESKSTA